MAVTIKDIAEYAGVSAATVSLALRDRACVAVRTRQRIRRLAADLGYHPSDLGRALQSGRSRLIGYLLPDVSSSYFNAVLQGVGHAAAAHGYGLLTAITGDAERATEEQWRIFREKRIDGLLVSSAAARQWPAILAGERQGCPAVFCSMASPLPGLPAAVTDNVRGGRLAAAHLLACGARRPAYFSTHGRRDLRYEGFAGSLAGQGIPAVPFLADRRALARALRGKHRPDAVFAFCDDLAVVALAVIAQAGLAVPGEVLVMGFDNAPFAAFPGYRLTSVEPQKQRIGATAVRLLLERLAGKTPASVLLAPRVIPRASTARQTGAS